MSVFTSARRAMEEFNDNLNLTKNDGTPLTYYGQWSTRAASTEALLRTGHGMCGAWTQLFIDTLMTIGVPDVFRSAITGPVSRYSGEWILVNNWEWRGANLPPTFSHEQNLRERRADGSLAPAGGPAVEVAYTHFNGPHANDFTNPASGIQFAASSAANEYRWLALPAPGLRDLPGVAAQTAANPFSIFPNHALVLIGGRYYDPSYGVTYLSLQQFEANAVAGFMTENFFNERALGIDLDGDDRVASPRVRIMVFEITELRSTSSDNK